MTTEQMQAEIIEVIQEKDAQLDDASKTLDFIIATAKPFIPEKKE